MHYNICADPDPKNTCYHSEGFFSNYKKHLHDSGKVLKKDEKCNQRHRLIYRIILVHRIMKFQNIMG